MKQIEEEWVDETFVERIIGLGEMFPTPVRNAVSLVAGTTSTVSCAAYKCARFTLWAGTTSFMILCLPVVFEQERYNLEQQQQAHQKRMLLGPNAGMSG